MDAPHGECVRGVAAGDEDHVRAEDELAQVGGRPRVEQDMRGLGAPGERAVEPRQHRFRHVRGRRDEQHPRPARELEQEVVDRGAERVAAHPEDPSRHAASIATPSTPRVRRRDRGRARPATRPRSRTRGERGTLTARRRSRSSPTGREPSAAAASSASSPPYASASAASRLRRADSAAPEGRRRAPTPVPARPVAARELAGELGVVEVPQPQRLVDDLVRDLLRHVPRRELRPDLGDGLRPRAQRVDDEGAGLRGTACVGVGCAGAGHDAECDGG